MIDSVLFAVDVPAGSYTAGQVISMPVIRGPSVVRDGYGTAKLKQVLVLGTKSAIATGTYVSFKNANWVDDLKTMIASAGSSSNTLTLLTPYSPCLQRCGDIELQPNSSFEVNLVIGQTVTTNADNTVICLADIDYPSVSSVANPRDEAGAPVSIMRSDTVTAVDNGDVANLVWTTVNVDEFKAGYRYLLAQIALVDNQSNFGFVAFSGAAGMNGLVRIIPVCPSTVVSGRMMLEYSTPLVKGPMNIEYALIGTAGTYTAYLECDYIRR